jgi:hypothetical protein
MASIELTLVQEENDRPRLFRSVVDFGAGEICADQSMWRSNADTSVIVEIVAHLKLWLLHGTGDPFIHVGGAGSLPARLCVLVHNGRKSGHWTNAVFGREVSSRKCGLVRVFIVKQHGREYIVKLRSTREFTAADVTITLDGVCIDQEKRLRELLEDVQPLHDSGRVGMVDADEESAGKTQ